MGEPARTRPEEIIRRSLRRSERIATLTDKSGRETVRKMLRLLEESDRSLAKRLSSFGEETFSYAQAFMFQTQIRQVLEYTKLRLRGLTRKQSEAAMLKGIREDARILEQLEKVFTGVVSPITLREAEVIGSITDRLGSTLLRKHKTSFDRYGGDMIREFEEIMSVGMLTGQSSRDMVNALVGHKGPVGEVSLAATVDASGRVRRLRTEHIPEGLFVRKRYWAWRIVRTEVAHAHQSAKHEGMRHERRASMPDMQRKILATLDNRVAADSLGVHGQVRGIDEMFKDGAGRQYLHPPARPNDRETIVPWRPKWPENPVTKPRTQEEIAEALRNSLPKQRAARARAKRKALEGARRAKDHQPA